MQDGDMTGPHEEDCKAGMSGSQLVSGGEKHERGPAREERGGQATAWVWARGGCRHDDRRRRK